MAVVTQQRPVNRLEQDRKEITELQELERCRASRATGYAYFVRHYIKIYETRPEYGVGWKPFELWPRQEEYLQFLENAYALGTGTEVVAEKPRDAGISYLTLAWIFAHWLFDDSFHALLGTLTEAKLALSPGHDTQFAKLRGFVENLPDFLLPKDFNINNHLLRMSLTHPNGNVIRGEIGKENFGRQNRAGVVFRDESAFWDDDTSENTVSTAQLNIDVSSVNGLNHFYRQGEAAAKRGLKFIFDRRDNPRMTDEWYAANKSRAASKGALALAEFYREIDRNYKSGVVGQIYPMINDCMRGSYEYRADWPLFTIWDYGFSDMGYLGFLQRNPDTGDLYLIDEVYNSQVNVEWFVPFIPGKLVTSNPYRYGPEHNEKILQHKEWTGPRQDFGDPTGNQRTAATGQSVFDILAPYGIRPRCKAGWNNMAVRQQKASQALPRLSIDDRCEYFVESFSQFVVPKRSENSQATGPVVAGVHKWSHAPSAFEAFAISEPMLEADKPKVIPVRSNPWEFA